MARTLAAVVTGLVLAGSAFAGSGPKPTLTLKSGAAVQGHHFRSHELVRVVFGSGGLQARRVRASAAGSFLALLPATSDRCSGLMVRATGISGDFAVLRVPPPMCAPAAPTAPGGADGTPRDDGLPPNADGPPDRNNG